jgi:dihydroneopterin aldolase
LFVILSMEKIIIKDIRLVGFHGLYDYEKKDGVNLGFDIELFFHNQINNNSDDINKTINYVDVIDTVKRINSSGSFNLIETLCHNLLNEILELYKPLKAIVRIRKFKLPIDTPLSFIEVEMTKENNV